MVGRIRKIDEVVVFVFERVHSHSNVMGLGVACGLGSWGQKAAGWKSRESTRKGGSPRAPSGSCMYMEERACGAEGSRHLVTDALSGPRDQMI